MFMLNNMKTTTISQKSRERERETERERGKDRDRVTERNALMPVTVSPLSFFPSEERMVKR